jgi:signal peptidase II
MKLNKSFIYIVGIILLVVALDQITKEWILARFSYGQVQPVINNFFNLTLTFNPGVAFGLFSNLDPLVRALTLSSVSLIAIGVIIYLMRSQFKNDAIARVALSMILGGAFGNIIDRLRFGAVVDFLDFYYMSYHWPAFNIADSAICVAVFILIFRQPKVD